MHSSIFCLNPCALRAHGFKQMMLECIQSQLQPPHRLSRLTALALTPGLPCAQVRTIVYMEQDDHWLQLQTLGVCKKQIRDSYSSACAHMFSCMCYRGLHLNLPCASLRVDLHVILMLERQFICFLLISLRPSALPVIFSCALGLRNPSAFFSCCTSCTLCHLLLSSHRCLHFLGCGFYLLL